MAYREDSYYPSRSTRTQPRERKHTSRRSPEVQPRRTTHARYTSPRRQAPSPPPPQRRRWATGYIDRQSCPSYAYIKTRSRSPEHNYPSDTEYISPPRYRSDDYIQPRERRHRYSCDSVDSTPGDRHSRDRHVYEAENPPRASRPHTARVPHGSDVESLDTPSSPFSPPLRQRQRQHRQPSPALSISASDGEERSGIASSSRRPPGSDVVSVRRRRSSNSCSDTRSIGSLGARSDVQVRRGRRGSGSGSMSSSDSEGGYISLDEYILGSDCVSIRSREGSGSEGEGSDAVGSDVESMSDGAEGSDGVVGSDVESLSDGEDRIEADHVGDGARYRRW